LTRLLTTRFCRGRGRFFFSAGIALYEVPAICSVLIPRTEIAAKSISNQSQNLTRHGTPKASRKRHETKGWSQTKGTNRGEHKIW